MSGLRGVVVAPQTIFLYFALLGACGVALVAQTFRANHYARELRASEAQNAGCQETVKASIAEARNWEEQARHYQRRALFAERRTAR